MSPDKWLENHFGYEKFHGKFENITQIYKKLNLEIKSKVLTIAGTNGKGQTSRLIDLSLRNLKKTTSLWTSPHLITVCERFVFNGKEISSEKLIELFEEMKSKLANDIKSISYFEFLFLVFMQRSANLGVDAIILEAGLGGRLDATNIVDADIVILTSIARDHQAFLGGSLKKILHEKIALTRTSKILITSMELQYINQLIEKYTQDNKVEWVCLKRQSKNDDFDKLNTNLALKAVELLLPNLTRKIRIKSLNGQSTAKRLSFDGSEGKYEFYPSHNPDGIRKLFQFLQLKSYNKLIVSFSKRPYEDLRAMVKTIQYYWKGDFSLCYFELSNACEKNVLKKLGHEFEVKFFENYESLYASQCLGTEKVLVTGSNYFISDYYQWISTRSQREVTI